MSLKRGDRVKISNISSISLLDGGKGTLLQGRIGTVKNVDSDGDCQISVNGSRQLYWISPLDLTKMEEC